MSLLDNLTKGMKEDMVKSEMIKQRDAAKKANPAVKSLSAVCVIDENDVMSNRVFGSDVLEWIKTTEEGALKTKAENETLRKAINDLDAHIREILKSKKADSTKIKLIKTVLSL